MVYILKMSDLSIAVLLKFDLLKSQKVGFYLIFQAILTAKSVYSENKQLWISKENNIRACDRNSSRFQDPLCSSSLVTQTQFYSEQKCAHLINYISKFLAFRRNMWLSSGQKKKKQAELLCEPSRRTGPKEATSPRRCPSCSPHFLHS